MLRRWQSIIIYNANKTKTKQRRVREKSLRQI